MNMKNAQISKKIIHSFLNPKFISKATTHRQNKNINPTNIFQQKMLKYMFYWQKSSKVCDFVDIKFIRQR